MNYMNFVFTKSKKNILTFTFFSGDSFPVDPKPTLSLTYLSLPSHARHGLCHYAAGLAERRSGHMCFGGLNV